MTALLLVLVKQQAYTTDSRQISFYSIRENERICFTVGETPAFFRVEVYSSPKPIALIRLAANAAGNVEDLWGHHTGESVEKPLTPADLRLLEDRLLRIQSQCIPEEKWKELDRRAKTQNPWGSRGIVYPSYYDFDLQEKVLETKETDHGKPWWRWYGITWQRYFVSERDKDADHKFVRTFVGFNP
jgi:hypothetical protein